MFNFSGSELVFVAILGLIVLGPEKLPGAMRRAGKIYREIRSISSNVQREVQKVMDEPMREVRKMVDEPMSEIKKTTKAANDVFAGKMPHLSQKPAAAAAAAFSASTQPVTPATDESATPEPLEPASPTAEISVDEPEVPVTDTSSPD